MPRKQQATPDVVPCTSSLPWDAQRFLAALPQRTRSGKVIKNYSKLVDWLVAYPNLIWVEVDSGDGARALCLRREAFVAELVALAGTPAGIPGAKRGSHSPTMRAETYLRNWERKIKDDLGLVVTQKTGGAQKVTIKKWKQRDRVLSDESLTSAIMHRELASASSSSPMSSPSSPSSSSSPVRHRVAGLTQDADVARHEARKRAFSGPIVSNSREALLPPTQRAHTVMGQSRHLAVDQACAPLLFPEVVDHCAADILMSDVPLLPGWDMGVASLPPASSMASPTSSPTSSSSSSSSSSVFSADSPTSLATSCVFASALDASAPSSWHLHHHGVVMAPTKNPFAPVPVLPTTVAAAHITASPVSPAWMSLEGCTIAASQQQLPQPPQSVEEHMWKYLLQ